MTNATSASPSLPLYSKLDPLRREIRLLTIYSSEDHTEPIHAGLHVVSLYHHLQYEALSYCWGSKENQRSISLLGQEVKITTNLHSALLRLREERHPRILWIDALCINQEDVVERGSQVLLMENIYKSCKSCFIWLGEPNNKTSIAIRVLRDWAEKGHLRDYNFGPKHIIAAAELTSRPWFSRIWTVPESILPHKLDVICGEYTWPWSIFADSAKSLEKHLTSPCCSTHNDTANEHILEINKFIQAVSVIENSRDLYPRKRDPLTCLNSFRIRDATDARDKIYGLLSLIHLPHEKFVEVSYAEPVEKIYTGICKKFIEHSGFLEVLKYVLRSVDEPKKSQSPEELEISKKPKHILPSWVPNWRVPITEPWWQQGRLNRYSLYNASGNQIGKRHKPEFLDMAEKSVLKVNGISCSIVAGVGKERRADMGEELPKNWYDLAKASRGGGAQVVGDAFFNTILMDTFVNLAGGKVTSFRRATKADYKEYQKWPTLIVEGSWPKFTDRLHFSLETATLLRSFFVTGDGHFGMGPAGMKKGDEIFVLEGGRCPLVLRSKDQNDHYTLVGDCYLHKFMDGEAMAEFESHSKFVYIDKESIRFNTFILLLRRHRWMCVISNLLVITW
jgi:hypothetical protein